MPAGYAPPPHRVYTRTLKKKNRLAPLGSSTHSTFQIQSTGQAQATGQASSLHLPSVRRLETMMLSCWKGCAQAAQATNPLRPKSVKAARSSHCASCTHTPRPAATLALGNAVRLASLALSPTPRCARCTEACTHTGQGVAAFRRPQFVEYPL